MWVRKKSQIYILRSNRFEISIGPRFYKSDVIGMSYWIFDTWLYVWGIQMVTWVRKLAIIIQNKERSNSSNLLIMKYYCYHCSNLPTPVHTHSSDFCFILHSEQRLLTLCLNPPVYTHTTIFCSKLRDQHFNKAARFCCALCSTGPEPIYINTFYWILL